MTEKELHKLRRVDLLQLLLSQSKDVAQMKEAVDAAEAAAAELRESNDRLKALLDEKEARIGKLIKRLEEKDARIAAMKSDCRLELSRDGATVVPLKKIFEAAEAAAEDYLRGLAEAGGETAVYMPEPEPEGESDAEPEPETESEIEPEPEAEPESKPEPETAPAASTPSAASEKVKPGKNLFKRKKRK